MRFFLPGFLLALWLLAWGEVSVGNVVSGIALIVVLLLAFPTTRHGGPRVRVHPIAMTRLVAYVLAQLVVSNVLVAREIVSRRSRVRTGVVGYRVQQPSDLTLTLMSNILALAPGTMPVDVTLDPPMLYVHFLLLSDVEDARRRIGRLETLVAAAVGWRSTTAHDRAVRGDES
jgi:multicomponent Na+:H+ antiporter subunit E